MKCKYCHKFAGIFSSKHKECEQKHIKSIKEIQDIVVEKLENSSLYDYCELKNELAEIAALGYVSDIEFENIIIISLKLFLTKKRIRINASNLKTFIYSLPENLKECITNEECYYEFWSNFFSIYFELGNYENLVEIQALMESIKVNDTISDKIDIALLCFLELRIHRFLSDGIIDYNEEQERQRDIAIASFEANKANADTLEQLYEKYKKLTPADDEFLTVQKDLVTALGDKATALEGLTVGSEEYTKAVEKMTEAELELYRTQLRLAAVGAKEKAYGLDFNNRAVDITTDFEDSFGGEVRDFLRSKGVEFGSMPRKTADLSGLDEFANLSQVVSATNELYNKYIREGDFEKANKLINSNFYKQISSWVSSSQGIVNDYLQTNTAKLLSDYEISTGTKVDTQEEFDEALKFIIENLGTSDFYDDMVKGFLSSFVKLEKEKPSGSGDGGSTETTDLKDVVDKLEQIRDNTQKTKDLEEKMLALEEARNQRTVRVYNAETGQWEMQVNEKAVAQAEKSLKDTAMDNILSYLSTDEAQEKLETGEFTLPDWLTAMIASPTGNDAFQAFMTSMGILSGAVNKTPMSSGAVVNSNASTTNNDSRTYTINGVPISKEDAERYTPAELFEMYNITG